jgi:hypothetical protein
MAQAAKKQTKKTGKSAGKAKSRKSASRSTGSKGSSSARSKPRAGAAGRKATGAEARRKALPPDKVSGAPAAAAAAQSALAGTRAAGQAVATATRRIKTPLIVGGGALAGVLGGLALRHRTNGSKFSGSIGGVKLPIQDGKVDLDAVGAAAERLESLGQQAGTVVSALRAQQGKS